MSMRCWLRGKFVYVQYWFFYKITVNSQLRISVISFSQHNNYVTVKFAMWCIQHNDKLVARLKIGLTAKQFWNESRGILPTRGPWYVVVVKLFIYFFTGRESNDRQTCEGWNEFNEIQNFLAKYWTYQTLDKCTNAAEKLKLSLIESSFNIQRGEVLRRIFSPQ